MRRIAALLLVFALALQCAFNSASADTRPAPEDRGATGLALILRRLQTIASALHTAAHPDDESTELLAYLARGEGARTAYLSVNRGEGGQNGIGPELWEGLGVIRTEELLAARKLDRGDLANAAGLDRSALHGVFTNERAATASELAAFARVLEADIVEVTLRSGVAMTDAALTDDPGARIENIEARLDAIDHWLAEFERSRKRA